MIPTKRAKNSQKRMPDISKKRLSRRRSGFNKRTIQNKGGILNRITRTRTNTRVSGSKRLGGSSYSVRWEYRMARAYDVKIIFNTVGGDRPENTFLSTDSVKKVKDWISKNYGVSEHRIILQYCSNMHEGEVQEATDEQLLNDFRNAMIEVEEKADTMKMDMIMLVESDTSGISALSADKPLLTLEMGNYLPGGIAIVPLYNIVLVTVPRKKEVRLYDLSDSTDSPIKHYKKMSYDVYTCEVVVTKDSNYVIVAYGGNIPKLQRFTLHVNQTDFLVYKNTIGEGKLKLTDCCCIALTRNDEMVLVKEMNEVSMWNLESGEKHQSISFDLGYLYGLAVLPKSAIFAISINGIISLQTYEYMDNSDKLDTENSSVKELSLVGPLGYPFKSRYITADPYGNLIAVDTYGKLLAYGPAGGPPIGEVQEHFDITTPTGFLPYGQGIDCRRKDGGTIILAVRDKENVKIYEF